MQGLSSEEKAAVERCAGEPMLDQVLAWSAVNSGSRNLAGLAQMAGLLADSFAMLPGETALKPASPVEAMASDGTLTPLEHGRNLHLTVRPQAPVQLLFTGHMDTVFGADHAFQSPSWLEAPGQLGGPGVADMKGGLAVMLAALKAVEASPLAVAMRW
jgi:glutamate carboxypeptidase